MLLSKIYRPASYVSIPSSRFFLRTMATINTSSTSHLERTANEPRDNTLNKVLINRIDRVNENIRLFQLKPKEGQAIKYFPGQWLDVHCPGIDRAGGFTITSAPPLLSRKPVQTTSFSSPYIELAIQKSAQNPPAVWLWQDEDTIIGKELDVRVGGSFVWPPEQLRAGLKRVVFIAGGVGINPFMSMLSSIAEMKQMRGKLGLGFEVRLLYSVKLHSTAEEILFLDRLKKVFEFLGEDGHLSVFVTGVVDEAHKLGLDNGENSHSTSLQRRRILDLDLEEALGFLNKRSDTVCYICGPPKMTDHFIGSVKAVEGIEEDNVLFEKWW